MKILDSEGINAMEPLIAPDLTDLVFARIPDEE